jgi:hypothetical protein
VFFISQHNFFWAQKWLLVMITTNHHWTSIWLPLSPPLYYYYYY